jgi:biotin transport system ATP-binding protein
MDGGRYVPGKPMSCETRTTTIALKDVRLRLEGAEVLRGLSATIGNRRTAIVGRNGSGKTTLARLIAGLIVPESGAVTINGRDMARDRKAALRSVGIIFQNPDHQIIFPTVEEEIAFGLTQLGRTRDAAAEETRRMLSRFGKSAWAGAGTHQLSQGQRKLVCLMAVLAMEPAVIVLDEPYAGLDIPTAMQLGRHVDAVETSVIQITHDPGTVRHFDRVIWIDQGRIEQDGPPGSVLPAFERRMRRWGAGDDLSDLAG